MDTTKPEYFGKYLLLEKLAMGGMAEIFLAKSTGVHGIGKFLAIKRILPQYSANESFIKMFTEEAKICMNLSHSNIAKIYEFGVETGRFFIVMELIEGKNLRQILSRLNRERRQGFGVDQAIYMIKEVASGLDNAHRCLDDASGKPLNIIHRDMSPQNVMLSYEGEVKVVDFGIAKAEGDGEDTKAGTLKGKFSYMSPEQASGEKIDLRTDVFSLGIVLWEILANRRLFASSNEMNTLKKVKESKIPSISKINPKVPEELERIVNIALSKNVNTRYQTCAELYKDLNRCLNRFYPDFSPQDFSIFIKSLYADEVLKNRKKFIEYSKLSKDMGESKKKLREDTIVAAKEDSDGLDGLFDLKSDRSVSLDVRNLKVNKTQTNFKRKSRGTKFTRTGHVRPVPKKKTSLFSAGNLALLGLSLTALALIVSQILPDSQIEFLLDNKSSKHQSSFSKSLDKSLALKNINRHSIIIDSAPSGAEISINGKSTGLLTPGRVSIPIKEEFNLSLKREGYFLYTKKMKSRGQGTKEKFTLQKINLAYLNIYSNSKSSLIYINGKRLSERTPLKNYKVPSGQQIKIKVVDRYKNFFEEKTIKLKTDERKTLSFKMKNKIRK